MPPQSHPRLPVAAACLLGATAVAFAMLPLPGAARGGLVLAALVGAAFAVRDLIGAAQARAARAAATVERAAARTELEAASRTDGLTGLPNGRAWEEELVRELARAARYGRPVSVALLGLDRFAAFNAGYGHQAGDRLLKNAAAAWAGGLRDVDLLARLSGDRFAALLPGSGLEDSREVVDRLRAATPLVTCSAGVATWDGMEDAASLLARAEQALAAVKRAGGDHTGSPAPGGDAA